MEDLVAVLQDINRNLMEIGVVLVALVIVLALKDTNGNGALDSIRVKLGFGVARRLTKQRKQRSRRKRQAKRKSMEWGDGKHG